MTPRQTVAEAAVFLIFISRKRLSTSQALSAFGMENRPFGIQQLRTVESNDTVKSRVKSGDAIPLRT